MSQEEDSLLPDPEKLELLVSYVRRLGNHLEQQSAVDIIVRNQITWPKLVV